MNDILGKNFEKYAVDLPPSVLVTHVSVLRYRLGIHLLDNTEFKVFYLSRTELQSGG